MKKTIILLMVLLVSLPAFSAKEKAVDCQLNSFSLCIGAGMKNISEDIYKDVYGSSGMSINVDVAFILTKTLEVLAHTDYFSKSGEVTLTKEETTLKVTPVELGFRYLMRVDKKCKLKLFPYIGAGGGYYMVKEENNIGTYEENKISFFVEGGFRFYMGSLFFDAKIKNVFLDLEDDLGATVKVGGLSYMGGIGISF
ncbi:MAG: outer membrane beta-barrel protein [bacterium]|nr:outer membrane beta-barrel protein [bacterium]